MEEKGKYKLMPVLQAIIQGNRERELTEKSCIHSISVAELEQLCRKHSISDEDSYNLISVATSIVAGMLSEMDAIPGKRKGEIIVQVEYLKTLLK